MKDKIQIFNDGWVDLPRGKQYDTEADAEQVAKGLLIQLREHGEYIHPETRVVDLKV